MPGQVPVWIESLIALVVDNCAFVILLILTQPGVQGPASNLLDNVVLSASHIDYVSSVLFLFSWRFLDFGLDSFNCLNGSLLVHWRRLGRQKLFLLQWLFLDGLRTIFLVLIVVVFFLFRAILVVATIIIVLVSSLHSQSHTRLCLRLHDSLTLQMLLAVGTSADQQLRIG